MDGTPQSYEGILQVPGLTFLFLIGSKKNFKGCISSLTMKTWLKQFKFWASGYKSFRFVRKNGRLKLFFISYGVVQLKKYRKVQSYKIIVEGVFKRLIMGILNKQYDILN